MLQVLYKVTPETTDRLQLQPETETSSSSYRWLMDQTNVHSAAK